MLQVLFEACPSSPSELTLFRRRCACGARRRRCTRQRGDREHDEPDTGKQERGSDDEAEERQRRRHVADVQGGRKTRLTHPDVASTVFDRLVRRRVDFGALRIVRPAARRDLGLRRVGLGRVRPISEYT